MLAMTELPGCSRDTPTRAGLLRGGDSGERVATGAGMHWWQHNMLQMARIWPQGPARRARDNGPTDAQREQTPQLALAPAPPRVLTLAGAKPKKPNTRPARRMDGRAAAAARCMGRIMLDTLCFPLQPVLPAALQYRTPQDPAGTWASRLTVSKRAPRAKLRVSFKERGDRRMGTGAPPYRRSPLAGPRSGSLISSSLATGELCD